WLLASACDSTAFASATYVHSLCLALRAYLTHFNLFRELAPLRRDNARTSNNLTGSFVDRNVFTALCVERLASPATPTLAPAETGELRHQVKLRGPSVADL